MPELNAQERRLMHVDGSCHCGYITYEAEVDPADVGLCHCTDCQQLTGSAFTTFVPTEAFRLLSGSPKIYVKTGSSAAVPQPARYNLRVGTIRQRRELAPHKQMWCGSALDWVMDLRPVTRFPKEP